MKYAWGEWAAAEYDTALGFSTGIRRPVTMVRFREKKGVFSYAIPLLRARRNSFEVQTWLPNFWSLIVERARGAIAKCVGELLPQSRAALEGALLDIAIRHSFLKLLYVYTLVHR